MKSKPLTMACFNCDQEGHYANKCPLLKREKKWVHLRAAHTVADEADDEKDEGVSDDSQNGSESLEAEDLNTEHVIEIAASKFYDNVAPDPEFLTSLHVFPIWDQRQKRREKPYGAWAAAKPEIPVTSLRKRPE